MKLHEGNQITTGYFVYASKECTHKYPQTLSFSKFPRPVSQYYKNPKYFISLSFTKFTKSQ